VKEGTGSHVVVRTNFLTDDIAQVAAKLAAFHSSKSAENKVEVVYTQIKNVLASSKKQERACPVQEFSDYGSGTSF